MKNETHIQAHTERKCNHLYNRALIRLGFISSGKAITRGETHFPQIKCDFHLYAMLLPPDKHYCCAGEWGGGNLNNDNQSIPSWVT